MITFLLALLLPSANAMEHKEIVKAMNSEKLPLIIKGKQKKGVEVPLNSLFDTDTKLRVKKPKPSPSPMGGFSMFHTAYAFSPAKPEPTPTPQVTEIDLRGRDCPVVNQWNGTCTAHGLTAAIENVIKCETNLSERHLWSKYQQYSVYPAIKAAKTGVWDEKAWPHSSSKKPEASSPAETITLLDAKDMGGDINDAIESLSNGNPVYVAMNTPIDLLNCHAVVRETTEGSKTGGHAMSIVGFKKDATIKSGGYFILKNSWGKQCGDAGYQYLPFSYCSKPDNYCLFFEISKVNRS